MSELLLGVLGRRLLKDYGWMMLGIVVAPAVILIPVSFSSQSAFVFPPKQLSFEWYGRLIHDESWRDATTLSLQVATFAAVLATLLGTQAAIALSRLAPRHSRYVK